MDRQGNNYKVLQGYLFFDRYLLYKLLSKIVICGIISN